MKKMIMVIILLLPSILFSEDTFIEGSYFVEQNGEKFIFDFSRNGTFKMTVEEKSKITYSYGIQSFNGAKLKIMILDEYYYINDLYTKWDKPAEFKEIEISILFLSKDEFDIMDSNGMITQMKGYSF